MVPSGANAPRETPDKGEEKEDTVPFVDEVENQTDELISDISRTWTLCL